MTVTINTLGTNSRQIVIDSETSATNIIAAVNTSLTALGWTLIDTVTSGSRGLLTTKVYSAPNADTVTTKYMIIRYDLHRQYWFTSCCESWNTTTNVATNECWYGGRQILLPLQYSNCTLYVFATARYACFMGVVSSEPSAWQGVFEFERVAAEDIASPTVPCFGWTSSLTIGEPYGNIIAPASAAVATTSASNGFVAVGFAPPRTKNGLTGTAAAGVFNIMTSLGSFPPNKGQAGADWSSGGVTQTLNSHTNMLGTWGDSSNYVWDTNKIPISNLKLNGYSSLYLIGRIYGLKITAKLGLVLDTTTVPVDANLFYSAGGSNTTHYLLGIHGGYIDKLVTGTNRLTGTVTTSGTAFGTPWQSVFVSGRFLYFTTTTGFHKFDTQTQGFTLNILPAAAYYSVKFDGENSLYVTGATANTVYKINLSDDTNTTLSMTGSWASLAIDDDNLYVGSITTGTTTTVKRVALSTFTEATSYNVTTGNAGNGITHMSTADYAGYLYVTTIVISPLSNGRITRITISNSSQATITPTTNLAGNTSASWGQPLFFDGTYLNILTSTEYALGDFNASKTFRVRISDFTLISEMALSANVTSIRLFGVNFRTLGCLEPMSFAGCWIIPATDGNGNTFKIVFTDPRVDLITPIPAVVSVIDASNINTGQYSTDQCSLYVMSGTTKIVRYTNAFRTYNFNGVQTSNLLIAQ